MGCLQYQQNRFELLSKIGCWAKYVISDWPVKEFESKLLLKCLPKLMFFVNLRTFRRTTCPKAVYSLFPRRTKWIIQTKLFNTWIHGTGRQTHRQIQWFHRTSLLLQGIAITLLHGKDTTCFSDSEEKKKKTITTTTIIKAVKRKQWK